MGFISSYVVYLVAFLGLYIQVFFFVIFLEKRKELSTKKDKPTIFPSLGIIIPCWNEEATVSKTILSLLDLEYPKDKLKIFVVDDGSTDNTFSAMKVFESNPQVQIYTKENGGKHGALNYALARMDTELVSSIDADTILEKDALQHVVKFFEDKKDAVAVGCTVLIGSPKTFIQKAQSIEYQMFSFSKKMLGLIGGVLVAPGAFSVFKRKVLNEVGGWKHGHSLEDLELTYRIQTSGYKADHCHTAIAHTKGPESLKQLFKQRLRWGFGFLKNTSDYSSTFFNRKLGNFGIFTVPMSVIAYFAVMFIFFYSWERIGAFFYDKIITFNTVGWDNLFMADFNMSWFFVNTQAISFISVLLLGSLALTIFLGRHISDVNKKPHHILWYFIVFSFLQPLWVLKSVYNYFFTKAVAWR